jgi:hypothetical protein
MNCRETHVDTHSVRLGAAKYCMSSSVAAPGPVEMSLRAGWLLTGLQSFPHMSEEAGDQYIGRTVAGLPPDRADFATLPPMFWPRPQSLDETINAWFPNLPENMLRVAEFALASIVFHKTYLLVHCRPRIYSSKRSCSVTPRCLNRWFHS